VIAAVVDDLTITGHPDVAIFEMKQRLNGHFKMKDLGELHWLLNMEIKQDCEKCTISFTQHLYIDLILKCFNLQDAPPVTILIICIPCCQRNKFCQWWKKAKGCKTYHTVKLSTRSCGPQWECDLILPSQSHCYPGLWKALEKCIGKLLKE
jgi:hypothetical protein